METPAPPQPDPDAVRAEYAALTSYVTSLVGHRFTILGFYLAAVGFIVGGNATRADGFLLIGITVGLWLMEVRNRSLTSNLSKRGAQIEREVWGYTGRHTYEPFFNRQIKTWELHWPSPDDPERPAERRASPPADSGHIWKVVPVTVGYTLAFDLLFSAIGAYGVFVAIHG
jgi:hypothetical protein